ncbi:hypothetical protein IBX65_00985 [Candidatus Aerophobetes bacterium]|nr:hypothetical protein [Candidatus Aerophobetes bacterium]
MRKLSFVLTGILILTFTLFVCGGWAASPPSPEKVAELQQAINEAHKLKEKADDARARADEEAWDEARKTFQEEYAKAKTDEEKKDAAKKFSDDVDKFLEEKLKELDWENLKKAKDEAFQKIIEAVDEAYDIDTSNVKGEPTFDQDQSEEGLCWPDGRVKLGPAAFTSPGWLASVKKHEATHADQGAQGRWRMDNVGNADQEIEAYGHQIISADTVGLSDAERAEVQKRLHYYLEAKKAALKYEMELATGTMDNEVQEEELGKIIGKIEAVQELEKKGDEEGAISKKDDAIEELDELIKGAKGETKSTLETFKEHVEELKEAEIFVIKIDTIEDLRDARDAATATRAQKDEINKIIGKIKNLIDAEKKGDEEKALEIKKDALKEINELLKDAKGEVKDNLEKAKEKLEKLIRIETKITVTGKAEGVGKAPDGSTVILVHTKECSRYTVTCTPGTTVKAGQTVTVSGHTPEPGKIKATTVTTLASPLPERKKVKANHYYQGPGEPLPGTGVYGSFVITPDTTVAVKANGATSCFFIDEEGEKKEELDKKDNYFVGILKPGIVGVVTAGIIDAIFNPQEKLPPKSPGIKIDPYYDGITNEPAIIDIENVDIGRLEDYNLSVEDTATGQIIDYGSPDLFLADGKTGLATATYFPGDVPAGAKEFVFTDPEGNILHEQMTNVYKYSLSFSPSRVTKGMPVFGDVSISGMTGEERVQVYLSFDAVLEAEIITGELISSIPGEVIFSASADEINQNPTDFTFDTSRGLGQQQVIVVVVPVE